MRVVSVFAASLSSTLGVSLVGLVLVSCGGSSDTTAPPPPIAVATVGVTPAMNSLVIGQTLQLAATTRDGSGNVLTGRAIAWSSSNTTIDAVSASGLVTANAVGSATIFATSEGRSGSATVAVSQVPVSTVSLTPPTATIAVATTLQLAAATTDAAGHALTGRTIVWNSAAPAVATVSSTGLATAVAVGTAIITATSENKSDTAQITVQTCVGGLQLALGEVHTLTAAETRSLCINGTASGSEYALVAFGNSTVAASTVPVALSATNTAAVFAPLASRQAVSSNGLGIGAATTPRQNMEWAFRERERKDLASALSQTRRVRPSSMQGNLPSYLIGVSPTPTVGSIVQLNANGSGNLCTDPKQLHGARVVAVLPHTLVFTDTLSPPGGYSDAEMLAFGQSFDTLGYALDTLNFGAPTDIDGNGRVAILFTPGVNQVPGPPGGFVGGFFAVRDLLPVSTCSASNQGEMFYMPVPDPGQTINGNYASKSFLASLVPSTLVHELQHMINSGRRLYVNSASSAFEEVWLNEGLSHIAEELLYYRMSGNSPRSNIDLTVAQSTQAQVNAINTYQLQNLFRLGDYMVAPETNSPYSQVDGLQMRGAIWQLLRYSADRKGGSERNTWYALVNSTTSGEANFNAVFGDITTMTRDWSVAQIADDAGLGVAANYMNPSWNFRSLMPALNSGIFPLLTHALLTTPVNVSLSGGASAYVRFRISGNLVANVAATSSGQPVPSSVGFTLVRTQ